MHCAAPEPPERSRRSHINGTLNRLVTIASMRILISRPPGLQLVRSRASRLGGTIEHLHDHSGCNITIQTVMLKEALQPAIIRCMQRGASEMTRQMAQVHCPALCYPADQNRKRHNP